MGMFDYIKCEAKLPRTDREVQKEVFQTKSLECFMNFYVITKDKELIRVSKKEKNAVLYHGDIKFYTFIENPKDKKLKWYEYIARFTNGKLEYIRRLKAHRA